MIARFVVGALVLTAAFPVRVAEWRPADPDYDWSFPQDHWPHPGYKTEWWYLTGHLSTGESPIPRFGYQFTVFKVGVLLESPHAASSWSATDVLMAHAAITDLETGRHVFSEVLHRAVPLLAEFGQPPDSRIARSVPPPGTAGEWALDWNGTGFEFSMADDAQRVAFDLETRSVKPIVLQGPNGYSEKSREPSHASLYYSMTRLPTRGSLTFEDTTFVVSGTSWMDKEFSSDPLADGQSGWDWLSIQLEDGRDLMLFMLRDEEGEVDFSHATVVSAEGTPRYLDGEAWTASPTRLWRSPATGARYPIGWEVELPDEGLRFGVEALADDQENVSRLVSDLFYWEGAIEVIGPDGSEVGRGYLELTGYGTARPPAL